MDEETRRLPSKSVQNDFNEFSHLVALTKTSIQYRIDIFKATMRALLIRIYENEINN